MLYRFGSFEFDSQTRLLFRGQERIPLAPKAADLLLVLLEHENRLLSKDELLRLVWPGAFVEEGSLSKHIFLLRKTLGEVIETVPKRGYRFIGPVEHPAESNGRQVTIEEGTRERIVIVEEHGQTPPTGNRTRRRVAAVALLATLVAGSLGWVTWARRTAGAELRSILVLPFANVGGKAENEYFSDGLAEELIAAFSGVKGLRVIPRTTAFQFKGKSGDLRAIGHQLDTEAVLDGGVQREGDRLRVRMALTRVSDGETIWSHTYDQTAGNVFAMQDDIAESVIRALFPKDRRAADVPSPSGTKNIEAQNHYLKGNFIRHKVFNNSLADALALFQNAVQLDPSYAEAWAAQAMSYSEIGHLYERYPNDVFPLAVQVAQRALRLNPRLALAHATLGFTALEYQRDWAAAKRELDQATSLDPNDGESHHWLSHYWISLGRFKEAEDEARRARECDPLNFSIGSHEAFLQYEEGHFPEAIEAAAATLRMDPVHGPSFWYQMRAYEESGHFNEAIAIRRRLGWRNPSADELDTAFRKSGAPGYWLLLKEYWIRWRSAGPARPMEMAWICAHLGERQEALKWLAQAVEEKDGWAVYMNVEPPFAALRSDPDFQRIARVAGFP